MMDILFGDYVPPRNKDFLVDLFVKTEDGAEMTLDEAKAGNIPFRTILLKPRQQLKMNRNYYVVTDGVASQSGLSARVAEQTVFSSVYAPLYAEPSELRPIMKAMFAAFPIADMYVALRDAGIKAHQMRGLTQDANDSRYRPVLDRDTVYYPLTRFVAYEAARVLLSRLMMQLVNQQGLGDGDNNGGLITGDNITLGDFSVGSKSGGSGSGTTGTSNTSPATLIKTALDAVSSDLKFWTDAMMGRNARGYTTPVSASFRTGAGSPPDRGIDA
jgi:hypothetical protein